MTIFRPNLFYALWPDDAVREELARLQTRLHGRLTRPPNLHLTLAFLGPQPEALQPLFDREVEGFGEVFRMLSFEEIGTATLQSRAIAGVANKTLIFAMPGSTKACRTAWENIIAPQLDARTRPCNFHPHLKK